MPEVVFAAHARQWLARSIMDMVLLVICIGLAVSAPNFLSVENFLNILRAVSMLGIIAFGMTMVIIAKEIDLSVGSAVALCACVVARLMDGGLSVPLAHRRDDRRGFRPGRVHRGHACEVRSAVLHYHPRLIHCRTRGGAA